MATDVEMTDAAPLGDPIDLTGDEGVMKTILIQGTGKINPKKGSDVSVHYVGTLLDGTEFDSSRSRNEPFSFKLGEGQVIKGWDKCVASMVAGEKCKVVLKPDYAYGVSGSPPKIPPNATLVFEIELLSFESEKDLNKDGGVLKSIVTDGEGYKQPSYETVCGFRIKVTSENGEVLLNTFGGEVVTVTIGETKLMKGIETALKSMKKGERATFKVRKDYNEAHDEAFLKATAPALAKISSNINFEADIEMVDLTPPQETWELNGFAEKLDFALKRKADGNNFFSKGDLALAAKKYKKALKVFEYDGGVSDEEKAKAKTEVKLPCRLNLAQCYLKSEKYKKAIEQCNKALEIEAANIKGLWRRGTAYMESSEFVKSKQDFTRALEIEPENKSVKASMARLKKLEAEQDRKDKARFKNLFEKMREEDTAQSSPASAPYFFSVS